MKEMSKSTLSTCLLALAALFICARYICAAICTAGIKPDAATFAMALESTGPFLPALSIVCLVGSVAVNVIDVVFAFRARKKK